MRKLLLALPVALGFAFCPPAAAGQAVTYFDGETELEGYWADAQCPENAGPAPVVMIVHQWKGLGAYERRRAEQLSAHCFNSFAIDMYGKGVRPQTREEAGKQAGIYKGDPELARQRLNAALAFARSRTDSAAGIAAMGYCFGGTMALELARSGADIEGVVSFHGGLSTPAPLTDPDVIQASVQIHHGAADPHVPQQQVDAFIAEMETADADWMFIQYADAVHAFTEKEAGDDPTTGAAYNEKADIRSWAATLDFLEQIFGRNPVE